MFKTESLSEFTTWLDGLKDSVRGLVVARIKRLELGLMGDVEPVGEGVLSFAFTSAQVGASNSPSAASRSWFSWSVRRKRLKVEKKKAKTLTATLK